MHSAAHMHHTTQLAHLGKMPSLTPAFRNALANSSISSDVKRSLLRLTSAAIKPRKLAPSCTSDAAKAFMREVISRTSKEGICARAASCSTALNLQGAA